MHPDPPGIFTPTMFLLSTRSAQASSAIIPSLRRALHAGPGVEFGAAFRDPKHPTGLWYHPVRQQHAGLPPAWAVSLLPDAPKSTESATSMGILSPQYPFKQSDHGGKLDPTDVAASDPDAFKPNPNFFSWLHNTLRDQVVPNDALLDFEASQRESGWAHLAGKSLFPHLRVQKLLQGH